MSWQPQSQLWPSNQAVLFIHGIGSAKPGHYDSLLTRFDTAIGPAAAPGIAKYCIYYDDVNDWFQDKVKFSTQLAAVQAFIQEQVGKETDPDLGKTVAAYMGDVVLPVINEAARIAVRDRILAQILQIRLDGNKSGIQFQNQRISIVCHSMGCFHTYEALHAAASNPAFKLLPITDLMQFRAVMFMASPAQLIRSVAGALGPIIPKGHLAVLSGPGLFRPFEKDITGETVYSARNWVSITGDLDPVGGHFFKKKAAWAYMFPEGQTSLIDDQSALNIKDKAELIGILADIAVKREASPQILRDPHSWDNYIANHGQEIVKWMA